MQSNTENEDFKYKLEAPFILGLDGPTQSEKSTLVSKILQRQSEIFEPPADHIVYCFTKAQPNLFEEIKKSVPNIEFYNGLPEIFTNKGGHTLFILDDLLSEISNSDQIMNVFTLELHHQNISVILITQLFFHKKLAPLTRQLKYLVLMKNPRENSYVSFIGRQMNTGINY